jgi:hypothetical protein
MSMFCNICHASLGQPIYVATKDRALTSLCELRDGKIQIWACPACAHLCGEPLDDTKAYYASDYRILLDQDDEDQIYEVQASDIVYRTDHQVATLLSKIEIPFSAKFLDYGCAKASTPKRLHASRQDVQFHLFDVSEMYTSYWYQFVKPSQCAIHHTPANWQGHFDIVTSFFSLEHIPTPLDTVKHIASLLNDEGIFYGIVPDTFGNVADFVVIDHVNHFTAASLHTLLRNSGFNDIQIDAQAHRGALVFTARKNGALTSCPDVDATHRQATELARYWTQLSTRIQRSEQDHGHLPAAIYGSGFYGAYIASVLKNPHRVEYFLDASPYQQGKHLFGKRVIAPQTLPESVKLLYVGLNPAIARDVVNKMDWLKERNLRTVFLDQEEA